MNRVAKCNMQTATSMIVNSNTQPVTLR